MVFLDLRVAIDLVCHFWREWLLLGTEGLHLLPLLPILSEKFEVDGFVGVGDEGRQVRLPNESEGI